MNVFGLYLVVFANTGLVVQYYCNGRSFALAICSPNLAETSGRPVKQTPTHNVERLGDSDVAASISECTSWYLTWGTTDTRLCTQSDWLILWHVVLVSKLFTKNYHLSIERDGALTSSLITCFAQQGQASTPWGVNNERAWLYTVGQKLLSIENGKIYYLAKHVSQCIDIRQDNKHRVIDHSCLHQDQYCTARAAVVHIHSSIRV